MFATRRTATEREYHDELNDAQMKIVRGKIKSSFATFDVFNSEVDLTTCCFFTSKLCMLCSMAKCLRGGTLCVLKTTTGHDQTIHKL